MLKVLIVEDDPMVAELNRRYLEKVKGFSLAEIVNNSDAALTYLKTHQVDLILLDVFMPGLNGLELLSAIRRQQYGVDVILVTAARDKLSVQTALRQGAVDYLIKPFEFDRFQSALLSYKRRIELMEKEGQLCQQLLDEQVLSQHNQLDKAELPKGLDKHTMKRVWQCIVDKDDEFTAEEMSEIVGISQVSMRKYLKHLEAVNLLTVSINYGAVGRPISKYRCSNTDIEPSFI